MLFPSQFQTIPFGQDLQRQIIIADFKKHFEMSSRV